MKPGAIIDGQIGVHDHRWKRPSLILLGGLLIGLAASLPLAMVWPYPNPPSESLCINMYERTYLFPTIFSFHLYITLPFTLGCTIIFIFIHPLVWGSFFAAGANFGLLAFRLTGDGSQSRAAVFGGVSFFLASFIGSNTVSNFPNPDIFPVLLLSAFGVPFSIMSFGVAFLFALAIGFALRTRGLLWRAFVAATVTGFCYWLVAWILHGHFVMLWTHDATTPPLADSLPEAWRPMGPMMKTVFISNFVAGMIGGWTTLVLLTVRLTPRVVDSHSASPHASG